MKDSEPNTRLDVPKGLRPSIVCDLADCGCKSSTMIWVSHPLKAIWFETPKTASSAIKKTLQIIPARPPAGGSRFLRLFRGSRRPPGGPMFDFEMWRGDEHDVIRSHPDYFKFGIVRNPWDRMVSNWSMFCRARLPGREEKIQRLFGKPAADIGFDEFIRGSVHIHNHHWQPFVELFPWDGDTLQIDFVARLESLNDDWKELNRRLGIQLDLGVDNRTAHRHYREYYDDELRDIVATSFKDDIRVFGYAF